MNVVERFRFLHSAWRYRLRSERKELAFVLRMKLEGAVVLDIGANRGIYSYWLHRRVGPRGHVYAFEPQPELGRCLSELRKAFRLNNLTIVPCGLSSEAGVRELKRPRNHWGAASLEHDSFENAETLPIHVTTLDAFAITAALPRIRFIKCDIEGHEYECFRGGERLLLRDRPTILVECADFHLERLRSYLAGFGYSGRFFHRTGTVGLERLPELRSQLHPGYLNFVFEMPENSSVNSRPAHRAA